MTHRWVTMVVKEDWGVFIETKSWWFQGERVLWLFVCPGLLPGPVPAGPVVPDEPRLPRPQETRGHLGTLHQRVRLFSGSADGPQWGDFPFRHSQHKQSGPQLNRPNPNDTKHSTLCVSHPIEFIFFGVPLSAQQRIRNLMPAFYLVGPLSSSQVFLVTLSNLQLRNCLTDVNVWSLFANVNELCLVRRKSNDFLERWPFYAKHFMCGAPLEH